MNLTAVKHALARDKIQLSKSLGQNFLHDANQLRRIVGAAELSAADQVLEIGPGLGALTQPLLETGARVLCLEKDIRLVESLRTRFVNQPRLTLVHADALDYLAEKQIDWGDWKVVSNLPYSVASPLLVELTKCAGAPQRLVVTLQFEVAQRLIADTGSKEYGLLNLLVQLRYQPGELFKIPPTCFFPVPDVDSACVTLVRRQEPLLVPEERRAFEKIVKRGFSQRRKMMMKLLKADWPLAKLQAGFDQVGLSHQCRAETVRLDQYVELTKILNQKA